MNAFMPQTASVQTLQKGYRKVLDYVMEEHAPVVILNNNQPEAVIIDIFTYQNLLDAKKRKDMSDALEILKLHKEDKDLAKLADTISDLIVEKYKDRKIPSIEQQLKDL